MPTDETPSAAAVEKAERLWTDLATHNRDTWENVTLIALAEQAREIAQLTTILTDVTADANLSHQQITRLEEEVGRVRGALEKARETIQALHGQEAWDIYEQHSPEMKQIDAALRVTPEAGG